MSQTTTIVDPDGVGGGDQYVRGAVGAQEQPERPELVVDVMGLMGDSIDNIKGVPGIGEKGAKELIGKYGRSGGDTGSAEVQVALLTIYDMCKAVDRGMTITDVKLLEKRGGKSGTWVVGE